MDAWAAFFTAVEEPQEPANPWAEYGIELVSVDNTPKRSAKHGKTLASGLLQWITLHKNWKKKFCYQLGRLRSRGSYCFHYT